MVARRQGVSALLHVLAGLVAACTPQDNRDPEPIRSTTSALAGPTVTVSVDVQFPAGYGLSSVAVGAANSLEIDDKAKIIGAPGQPGTVTNSGSGATLLKNGAVAGTIASVGNIQIGNQVTAASVVAGGAITLGQHDVVGATTPHATLTPLVHRTLSYHSSALPSDVTVQAKAEANLTPGAYGTVVAKPNARLKLSAGSYLLDAIDIEPGATVQLDTSRGTIKLYVRNAVTWQGSTSGDPGHFVFAYTGTDTLRLQGPLDGAVLAPQSTLELYNGAFHGTYYGKDVVVKPGVTVTQVPPALLIDGLSVTPTTVCAGQPAEVKLKAAGGAAVVPRIQGVVGDHQFVQLGGVPGTLFVFATVVTADGRADFADVPVTLQDCAQPAVAPVQLHYWGARGKPDVVDLSVSTYNADGVEAVITAPATYVWSFGDGTTATTTAPVAEHDYSAAVDHLAQFSYFNASVAVTTAAGTTTSQKVVSIWSLYAANRAKGVVQPPSTASTTPSSFVLTLKNYEPMPLTITQASVEQIPCDPGVDAQLLPPQPISVVIPAGGVGHAAIPPPPPAANICAVGMHVSGTTDAGDVRSDSYVRVGRKNPLTSQAVTDPATVALLDQAATLTTDPNRFDENELQALVNRGALARMPSAVPPGVVYANPGDECDPGDPAPAGLVCEPTSDWVIQPSEIINAYKGNFIMDHGCGNIGQLLAATGQMYSHDSVIVKNRTEVRHSTMAEDRVGDHALVLGLKVNSDVLRYGWPGTEDFNPHSISEMTTGYSITDPDNQTYRMGLEYNPAQNNQCSGDITAVPPLVIRPYPGCAPQPNLQPIVDQAMTHRSHYRFFMYSRADEPQTCDTLWCPGQVSTVCSLFARNDVQGAGLPLWPHGPLASRGPDFDGFNTYSEDVRTAGANAEFDLTYDKVHSKSWFGDFLLFPGYAEQFATNVGNQMTNCFATDGCDDTGDTWEENGVGDGIAVSPDDMIKWDKCTDGGTYGYNEPAVFLPTTFRHRYTLQKQANDGSITVVVEDNNGQPIQGVTVVVDTEVKGTTDSSGTVAVPAAPAGSHIVEAQQYTGPALTPVNLHPTPDQILALPDCPASPMCKSSICPSGWTKDTETFATVTVNSDRVGPVVIYEYACYPPVQPPPGCDLISASRTTTVIANQDDKVVLTLCTGSTCSNGVRASCQQNCASNSDCDNNQVCTATKCVVPPRVVHITDSGISGIVSGGCDCTATPNASANLDVTCDPTAQPNFTDWLCDAGHLNFCSSPIIGGVADATLNLNGNGDCNALLFHFVCTMDPLGTGGIIVGSDMRLLDGCGSSADDEANARQWKATFVPATSANPVSLACTGDASTSAGGTCDGFSSAACWHDGINACSPCCDNEADIGSALTYTSLPHP